MFHEITTAGELSPEDLRAQYNTQLADVIEEYGADRVATDSKASPDAISALAAGESPELTLETAATVLAIDDREPDAGAIEAETRDHLLMGMTTAVLDVEAVESGIDGVLDAKEIQAKIEGRFEMTLDELALLHSYIDGRRA